MYRQNLDENMDEEDEAAHILQEMAAKNSKHPEFLRPIYHKAVTDQVLYAEKGNEIILYPAVFFWKDTTDNCHGLPKFARVMLSGSAHIDVWIPDLSQESKPTNALIDLTRCKTYDPIKIEKMGWRAYNIVGPVFMDKKNFGALKSFTYSFTAHNFSGCRVWQLPTPRYKSDISYVWDFCLAAYFKLYPYLFHIAEIYNKPQYPQQPKLYINMTIGWGCSKQSSTGRVTNLIIDRQINLAINLKEMFFGPRKKPLSLEHLKDAPSSNLYKSPVPFEYARTRARAFLDALGTAWSNALQELEGPGQNYDAFINDGELRTEPGINRVNNLRLLNKIYFTIQYPSICYFNMPMDI